ncbi:aldo/keto reductase [Companilactobacillus sp.]|uniref:aldo/keto reductase n=1 Tax=Companilactobacillus sp. TaxID=2767905 RepID=UPI00261E65CF|nr:aldo/keto reductase [Companilactobacillus sp.]
MIPTITLNNGLEMPLEGFGTFQMTDFETCKQAVLNALDGGYRLIDTAQVYRNERAVGAALRETDIPRNEIFVTTKVWLPFYGIDKTQTSVNESLKRLGLDYLDLVLLHEPYSDYYGAYQALEKFNHQGIVRAIGVSNFDAGQILDLAHNSEITPAVNQVELNLYQQQNELRKIHQELKIRTEAWAPLGEASGHILAEPTVEKIAQQYHKTVAQVLLRYLIQLDAVIIPKSSHKKRMLENSDIWNFSLTFDEMDQLVKLNKNKWLSPDRHSLSATKHYQDLIDQGLDY